jgi:hypothetical protein
MRNSNAPSRLESDETLRALTEGEIGAIAGAAIVQVNGGGNTPNGNAIIGDGRARLIACGGI